jgi:hypothetical protein
MRIEKNCNWGAKDAPCKMERSDFTNFSARLLMHFKQPVSSSVKHSTMRNVSDTNECVCVYA